MEAFKAFINVILSISDFLWGYPIMGLSILTAVVLTLRLKGFQFRYFFHAFKETFGGIFTKTGGEGSVSPFQACCSAMASTLGVGNIAGVSVAIALGGPGAIFWMWFVALLGMITKYGEIVIAIDNRVRDENGIYHGGLMWNVEKMLPKFKWMAVIWCACLTFNLIFAPCVQANSIVDAATTCFAIPGWIIGVGMALLMGVILFGGLKRIADFADKMVPLMTLIYVSCSIVVILLNIHNVPYAFGLIFKGAFTGTAAVGGFAGSSLALATRWGVARGIYSNEAGNGMAALVHSSANVEHPSEQGLWGIVEVFVDTLIVCTMTALVVLTTGAWENGLSGAALTTSAFAIGYHSKFLGGTIVTIVIALFGFTTALVNVYQGELCFDYLIKSLKNKSTIKAIYRFIGCIFAVIGSTVASSNVWGILDFGAGIACITSLCTMIMLSGRVQELTEQYVERLKRRKKE